MKPDIADELFRKYYNEALLYTVTICGNRETAEDVVQTAFYRALQTSDDTITNFKAWLLAVCRNEYFSMARKKKHIFGEELDENHPDMSEDMLSHIIRQEEYLQLYRAISRLKPNQKEVIELFYFSDLSIRQISEITGSSENNVKVLLCRARLSLRENMGGN